MSLCNVLLTYCLFSLIIIVEAQITLTGSSSPGSTDYGDSTPSGGFQSYSSTRTLDTTAINTATLSDTSSTGSGSASNSSTSSSSTSATVTVIGGHSLPVNGTGLNATSTSTSVQPMNTQPCNGHPQFCSRKFSNVTHIAAHNSPFITPGNAASNQYLDVISQLNDGIRMLQFQTHSLNGTLNLCHTSCELLNAGNLESYLSQVTSWLRTNRFDVITILMGNGDNVAPQNYTQPIISSGLIDFIYTPPVVPMALDDWPTLGEMIINNTRAVVMLDYGANMTAVPYLQDEFAQMFETPFSPTDRSFPCTAERPPNAPYKERMYMANHNLNVNVSLGLFSLLTPAIPLLNETNSDDANTEGSLERMRSNCTAEWNRPPNFMLVDFYNVGNFNGSVFQVAANANNVTYDRGICCGASKRSDGTRMRQTPWYMGVFIPVMALGIVFA